MELAWTAGFVDGEGCFLWTKGAEFKLTNTHLPTLAWLKNHFGGAIYNKSTGKDPEHWRPRFVWMLRKREHLRPFMQAIMPHLREKRDQCLVLFDMMDGYIPVELGSTFLKRLKRPRFDLNDPLMEPKYVEEQSRSH